MDYWHSIPIGSLVIYSDHYLEESCKVSDNRIGILTDKEFFDSENGVEAWPVIFWEGATMANLVHPANAIKLR